MKTLDVYAWKQEIDTTEKRIQACKEQLQTIQKSIEKITLLEGAFSGQTADAIRRFYSTCHQPLLRFADDTLQSYEQKLQQMLEAIHTFESATDGFIQQQFLEGDVTSNLNKLAKVAEGITGEANRNISDVSDIVYLPSLNSSELIEKVEEAKEMSKLTVEKLEELDRTQSAVLNSVISDIELLKQFVVDIGNLLHNGHLSVRDINLFNLLSSGAYAEVMWKINPVYQAYQKFVTIISVMAPIALYFNPANYLPSVVFDQEMTETDANEIMK